MNINNKYNSDNIINIKEERFRRLADTNNIIEFGDRSEYCLINEYENKYDSFTYDSIE